MARSLHTTRHTTCVKSDEERERGRIDGVTSLIKGCVRGGGQERRRLRVGVTWTGEKMESERERDAGEGGAKCRHRAN